MWDAQNAIALTRGRDYGKTRATSAYLAALATRADEAAIAGEGHGPVVSFGE